MFYPLSRIISRTQTGDTGLALSSIYFFRDRDINNPDPLDPQDFGFLDPDPLKYADQDPRGKISTKNYKKKLFTPKTQI